MRNPGSIRTNTTPNGGDTMKVSGRARRKEISLPQKPDSRITLLHKVPSKPEKKWLICQANGTNTKTILSKAELSTEPRKTDKTPACSHCQSRENSTYPAQPSLEGNVASNKIIIVCTKEEAITGLIRQRCPASDREQHLHLLNLAITESAMRAKWKTLGVPLKIGAPRQVNGREPTVMPIIHWTAHRTRVGLRELKKKTFDFARIKICTNRVP